MCWLIRISPLAGASADGRLPHRAWSAAVERRDADRRDHIDAYRGAAVHDKQIELVTTFADQAVIAIENVRLFDEVQARTRDLTEALEQQTATSEVLQVISSSSGELEPVFEAMLANADASVKPILVVLFRYEEAPVWQPQCLGYRPNLPNSGAAARIGQVEARRAASQDETNRPPPRRPTEPAYVEGEPVLVAAVNLGRFRTMLNVPMLKENELIGAMRSTARKFGHSPTSRSSWSSNFAAQAVIAIENARLLNELRESLEQQTATADVLKVISRSTFDLQACCRRSSNPPRAFVTPTRGRSPARTTVCSIAPNLWFPARIHRTGPRYSGQPERGSMNGRTLLEGKVVHVPDVRADPDYTCQEATEPGPLPDLARRADVARGQPDRRFYLDAPEYAPSPTSRWSSFRPSPTKRRSRSRMCGCSTKSKTRAASLPRRASTSRSSLPI